MIELKKEQLHIIVPICNKSKEVLIRSAMEGKMGRIFVSAPEEPSCCLVVTGDFAYLIGIPPNGKTGVDLREQLYDSCGHRFLVPENERWEAWLEENLDVPFRRVTRYALKQPEQGFEKETLQSYIKQIPKDYEIVKMDDQLYQEALEEEWSRDFCSNYRDCRHFMEEGLGYAAKKEGKLASGCAAYGISSNMMEIQVQTKKEHQRQKLALACSAAFLLDCMEHGICPNWDAANLQSVGLAEKLGYQFDEEYMVYQL